MENGVCWWRGCHEWDSHSAHIRWTLCTSKHCATSLQHGRLVNSALSRQHSLQDRQLIIGHHCCLATHRTNLLSWCSCPNDGQETHSGQKVYVCVSICPSVCLCVCVFTPHWKITQNLVKSEHVVTSQQKPKCECEGKPSVLHKLVSEQKCVDRHQASLTSLFLKICSVNHRKSPWHLTHQTVGLITRSSGGDSRNVLHISMTWGQIVSMTKIVKIFRLFKLPVPLDQTL